MARSDKTFDVFKSNKLLVSIFIQQVLVLVPCCPSKKLFGVKDFDILVSLTEPIKRFASIDLVVENVNGRYRMKFVRLKCGFISGIWPLNEI